MDFNIQGIRHDQNIIKETFGFAGIDPDDRLPVAVPVYPLHQHRSSAVDGFDQIFLTLLQTLKPEIRIRMII